MKHLDGNKIIRNFGYRGHITIGGHFPTFEHKDILNCNKNIDTIVRNEGEFTLLELINNLDNQENFKNILGLSYRKNNKLQINPQRPLIEDLDSLPFPKRNEHSRYNEENHFTIITSRGCYGNCSFCSVKAFYENGKSLWRIRSPTNIVDEIKYLVDNYNAKVISFMDDIFIGKGKIGKRRALEIANQIVNQGIKISFEISCRPNDIDKLVLTELKRAGLKHVSIGIESGNNKILKRFNKNTTVDKNILAIKTLHEIDMNFTPYFIMFDPLITLNELKNNLHFLYSNNICTYQTVKNAITIYRGTPIYFNFKNELKRKNWVYQYNFKDKNIARIYFGLKEFHELSEIDTILNILAYYNNLNDSEYKNYYEELLIKTNEFIFSLILNYIDIVSNSSNNKSIKINNYKILIHDYVFNIKKDLKEMHMNHIFI